MPTVGINGSADCGGYWEGGRHGHTAVAGYGKNRPRDMNSTIQLWWPFGASARAREVARVLRPGAPPGCSDRVVAGQY